MSIKESAMQKLADLGQAFDGVMETSHSLARNDGESIGCGWRFWLGPLGLMAIISGLVFVFKAGTMPGGL